MRRNYLNTVLNDRKDQNKELLYSIKTKAETHELRNW